MTKEISLLGRRTMEAYLADRYAKIFPPSLYKERYREEKNRLQAMTHEEYNNYITKMAEAVGRMPCHECGCELNGNHEKEN